MNKFEEQRSRLKSIADKYTTNKLKEEIKRIFQYIDIQEKYYTSIPVYIRTPAALNTIIKKIVKNLPEQQREVIMMRDLDGYEFIEIAAATQLKIEHVRVLLSRARKQVSIKLRKTYRYERG